MKVGEYPDEISCGSVTLSPPTRRFASDYAVGELVVYVPNHANGDGTHPDCERGVVSTIKEGVEDLIWVRFRGQCGECCNISNIR